MVDNSQEYRLKYWATRSLPRSWESEFLMSRNDLVWSHSASSSGVIVSGAIDNGEGRDSGAGITFADKPMTEFTVDLNLTGPSRVVLRDEVVRESRSLTHLNEHEANMAN